jgi:hypothetical protein
MSAVRQLLERSTPGSPSTVRGHIRRCERLYGWIQQRWPEVGSPWQVKAKQLRAALQAHAEGVTAATAYDYWRAARAWAAAVGKWPAWEPRLRGPWTPKSDGGRPSGLARR